MGELIVTVDSAGAVRPIGKGKAFRSYGATSGYVGFKSPAAPTSYDFVPPSAAPGAKTTLRMNTDGTVICEEPSGGGSWVSASGIFKPDTAVIASGDQMLLRSRETDGASQIAHKFTNENSFANATAKLVSVYSDDGTTEQLYILKDGDIVPAQLGVAWLGGGSGKGWAGVRLGSVTNGQGIDAGSGLGTNPFWWCCSSGTYGPRIQLSTTNQNVTFGQHIGGGGCDLGILAAAKLSLDTTMAGATGDSYFTKSTASGGNMSRYYDGAEIERDSGSRISFLASRRSGPDSAIGTSMGVFYVTMFTSTADVTVANSTTATTLLNSGLGTKTVPASFVQVGTRYRVRFVGLVSTKATLPGNITFEVKLGATVVATVTVAITAALTNAKIELECEFLVRATGASGNVMAWGEVENQVVALAADLSYAMTNTAVSSAIDFTATKAIDVVVTWGTADASNTITAQVATIEVAN